MPGIAEGFDSEEFAGPKSSTYNGTQGKADDAFRSMSNSFETEISPKPNGESANKLKEVSMKQPKPDEHRDTTSPSSSRISHMRAWPEGNPRSKASVSPKSSEDWEFDPSDVAKYNHKAEWDPRNDEAIESLLAESKVPMTKPTLLLKGAIIYTNPSMHPIHSDDEDPIVSLGVTLPKENGPLPKLPNQALKQVPREDTLIRTSHSHKSENFPENQSSEATQKKEKGKPIEIDFWGSVAYDLPLESSDQSEDDSNSSNSHDDILQQLMGQEKSEQRSKDMSDSSTIDATQKLPSQECINYHHKDLNELKECEAELADLMGKITSRPKGSGPNVSLIDVGRKLQNGNSNVAQSKDNNIEYHIPDSKLGHFHSKEGEGRHVKSSEKSESKTSNALSKNKQDTLMNGSIRNGQNEENASANLGLEKELERLKQRSRERGIPEPLLTNHLHTEEGNAELDNAKPEEFNDSSADQDDTPAAMLPKSNSNERLNTLMKQQIGQKEIEENTEKANSLRGEISTEALTQPDELNLSQIMAGLGSGENPKRSVANDKSSNVTVHSEDLSDIEMQAYGLVTKSSSDDEFETLLDLSLNTKDLQPDFGKRGLQKTEGGSTEAMMDLLLQTSSSLGSHAYGKETKSVLSDEEGFEEDMLSCVVCGFKSSNTREFGIHLSTTEHKENLAQDKEGDFEYSKRKVNRYKQAQGY